MFIWKEEYELRIEEIDKQHKELFRIGNEAFKLLKDKLRVDKYNEILRILTELKEYTIYHFQYEENYMLERKNKSFLSHKVEHMNFIDKINSLDLSAIDLNQDGSILEILDFVYKWTDEHILLKDNFTFS